MGYSMSVSCKSSKARDKLAEFLKERMTPWHILAKDISDGYFNPKPSWDPTVGICVGEQIAYGNSPSKVGFNYSVGGDYADYILAVLRFSALRVGRARSLHNMLGHSESVRYTCYDSEAWPVLLDTEVGHQEDRRISQWIVDQYGFQDIDRWWERTTTRLVHMPKMMSAELTSRADKKEQLIHEEMKRLSNLWDKLRV